MKNWKLCFGAAAVVTAVATYAIADAAHVVTAPPLTKASTATVKKPVAQAVKPLGGATLDAAKKQVATAYKKTVNPSAGGPLSFDMTHLSANNGKFNGVLQINGTLGLSSVPTANVVGSSVVQVILEQLTANGVYLIDCELTGAASAISTTASSLVVLQVGSVTTPAQPVPLTGTHMLYGFQAPAAWNSTYSIAQITVNVTASSQTTPYTFGGCKVHKVD